MEFRGRTAVPSSSPASPRPAIHSAAVTTHDPPTTAITYSSLHTVSNLSVIPDDEHISYQFVLFNVRGALQKARPRHLRASADRGLLCLSVRAFCGFIYVSVASSVSIGVGGSSRRTPVRFRTGAQPPGPRPSRSLSPRHHGLSFGPPVHPHEQPDAVLSIHFIMSHAMCLVRHVPCSLCLA